MTCSLFYLCTQQSDKLISFFVEMRLIGEIDFSLKQKRAMCSYEYLPLIDFSMPSALLFALILSSRCSPGWTNNFLPAALVVNRRLLLMNDCCFTSFSSPFALYLFERADDNEISKLVISARNVSRRCVFFWNDVDDDDDCNGEWEGTQRYSLQGGR